MTKFSPNSNFLVSTNFIYISHPSLITESLYVGYTIHAKQTRTSYVLACAYRDMFETTFETWLVRPALSSLFLTTRIIGPANDATCTCTHFANFKVNIKKKKEREREARNFRLGSCRLYNEQWKFRSAKRWKMHQQRDRCLLNFVFAVATGVITCLPIATLS